MKKLLFTSLLLVSGSLFAAQSSDLPLQGIQPVELSIAFENIAADATDLILNAEIDHKRVSDFRIKSNSVVGFSLIFHSQNAGKMVHATDSRAQVAYTMNSIGQNGQLGQEVSLATDFDGGDNSGFTFNISQPFLLTSHPVMVSGISGGSPSQMLAGRYNDVITATIASH